MITNTATVTAATSDSTSPTTARLYDYRAAPIRPRLRRSLTCERFGFQYQPTILVISFSAPSTQRRALHAANYRICHAARPRSGRFTQGPRYPREEAPCITRSAQTVTLYMAQRLNIHNYYQITIQARAWRHHGSDGEPLAGADTGDPGSDFVGLVTMKTPAGRSTAAIGASSEVESERDASCPRDFGIGHRQAGGYRTAQSRCEFILPATSNARKRPMFTAFRKRSSPSHLRRRRSKSIHELRLQFEALEPGSSYRQPTRGRARVRITTGRPLAIGRVVSRRQAEAFWFSDLASLN